MLIYPTLCCSPASRFLRMLVQLLNAKPENVERESEIVAQVR